MTTATREIRGVMTYSTKSMVDRNSLTASELEGSVKVSFGAPGYNPTLTPAEARAFAAQLVALARRIENRNPNTIED